MFLNRLKLVVTFFCFLLTFHAAIAQEGDNNAQANNPLANMTALNFQNYFSPVLTNSPSGTYLNNTWVRFATPFFDGKTIFRVSAPLTTINTKQADGAQSTVSGLGDLNAFMAYNFVSSPTATVGIGPNITLPTATDPTLGTEKVQAGFALVAFVAKSPVFQFGGLITYQASVAGNAERQDTNGGAVQPFYFWQLGKGAYLRGAPIWVFNFNEAAYSVPIGLGIGKVVTLGNTVFNLFIEPQYSMLSAGVQPQLQIFTGINLQFVK